MMGAPRGDDARDEWWVRLVCEGARRDDAPNDGVAALSALMASASRRNDVKQEPDSQLA